jgi:spore coat protein U-like protein
VTGTTAGINETSCAGTGQLTLGTGNTVPTAQTIIPTGAGASGTFYMGQDVLLLLTSSTLSMGTYTDTMTVTLTLN